MRPARRRFSEDKDEGGFSPGWAIAMITVVLVVIGLGTSWLNEMHMYHYGLFGSQ